MPVGEVQSAARAAGLAWRTIERAKTRLGVRAALLGYGAAGRWQWSLAETASSPDHASETATPREVAVSGEKTEKLAQTPRARHSTADLAVVGPATGQTGDVPRERARF
jgi:hypothetical protein